ncbi:MAG TPA: tyrosine-type recombinase/integrase [Chitinophagaceae bacterium]
METVTLKAFFHNEMECIGIFSGENATLNTIFQKKAGARWSRTHKCWYMPCTKKNYEMLANALSGKAILQTDLLKQYLENKKNKTVQPLAYKNKSVAKQETKKTPAPASKQIHTLSKENSEALQQFHQQLILKSYSASTIRTYTNEFVQFLNTINNVPAYEFSTARIKDYLQYCFEKLKLSENTLHSRMNALKFYYEQVLKKEKFFWEIPRPKKPMILPKLLNETELGKLFNALTNRKHKAMLFTAYSAGLRVSEIVNLKISDIDSKRMQIFIERAKGKKDRYVNLSPILLDILRKYLLEYKPSPKIYLFESEQTFTAYPTRTVQQIFSTAKQKAGISKAVGVHSLRHSFATHLLDKGTDIRFIKDLLGHFDIKTTERYLHVSRQKLINIISPLDDLMSKEQIDW